MLDNDYRERRYFLCVYYIMIVESVDKLCALCLIMIVESVDKFCVYVR